MNAKCCMKSSRVEQGMENEIKCMICDNTVFMVSRITPELVMLTCENCGESHMIGSNLTENDFHLTFWGSENEPVD